MLQLLERDQSTGPDDGSLVPGSLWAGSEGERRRQRRVVGLGAIGLAAVLVLAGIAFSKAVSGVSLGAVEAAFLSISSGQIALALLLTACSYMVLSGYDAIALSHLRLRLPFRRIALGAFTGYAVANNLGFALLTGGSVRYRLYAAHGVRATHIALVSALGALTFVLAATVLLGSAMFLSPERMGVVMHVSPTLAALGGFALISLIAIYATYVGLERRAVSVGGETLALPGARSTLAQISVGLADLMLASGTLYVLLPVDPGIGFWPFASAFAAAIAFGLVSNVPGGLGVFETVLLVTVPGIPTSDLVACLLLYRVVYYLVPFAVAAVVLVLLEANRLPLLRAMPERAFRLARSTMRSLRSVAQRGEMAARPLMRAIFRRLGNGLARLI
ncbi:MAG: lysylphosphatidylglycerol synthase domain-containing protein [Hyphomicrobiaceae bacterium]